MFANCALIYGFGKLFSGLHCCLLVTSLRLRGPDMDISGGRKHPCKIIPGLCSYFTYLWSCISGKGNFTSLWSAKTNWHKPVPSTFFTPPCASYLPPHSSRSRFLSLTRTSMTTVARVIPCHCEKLSLIQPATQ